MLRTTGEGADMKWQLGGPVGSVLIPAGTVHEGEPPVWNGVKLPGVPLDAVALDPDSALWMLRHYDPDLWPRIVFARDIDRAALLAQAAHERRYGRHAAVAVAIADAAESPPVAMAESPLEGHLPLKEEAAPSAPRSRTSKRK
jgi:hypothetical protein